MDYKRQDYRTEKTSEADKAGMNDLLARLREKREQAVKAQQELRDDEVHRTAQE